MCTMFLVCAFMPGTGRSGKTPAARRFYTAAFGLGTQLRLRASEAQVSGFRGIGAVRGLGHGTGGNQVTRPIRNREAQVSGSRLA